MSETLTRLIYSVCAMATARNLTKPYQLDALVGKAARALANGAAPIVAYEVARIAAADMQRCESVSDIVEQLIDQIMTQMPNGTTARQAL